ncbi:MAG: T9SS type A sorting domain-containing protein [Bacteroidia bacterium]|nr:T9SS type A sorting domain-containing protein [Bacteroidia bacterium]
MKKTYTLLIMIVFSGFFAIGLRAQSPTLEIQKKDQSAVQTPLSDLRKLTFSNDAMTVHYSNGQTGDIALSDISKMIFGTISGVKKVQSANAEILIYPNPASDYIYVKTTDNQTIQIINISGATVISQKASDNRETQIHIANLAKGVYILKLDHKVAKFTKL